MGRPAGAYDTKPRKPRRKPGEPKPVVIKRLDNYTIVMKEVHGVMFPVKVYKPWQKPLHNHNPAFMNPNHTKGEDE